MSSEWDEWEWCESEHHGMVPADGEAKVDGDYWVPYCRVCLAQLRIVGTPTISWDKRAPEGVR